MILKSFVYYDRKMGVYSHPIYVTQSKDDFKEQIIRTLKSAAAELPPSMADCDLFYLGTFDDNVCKLECLPSPEFILSVGQYYVKKENLEDEQSC